MSLLAQSVWRDQSVSQVRFFRLSHPLQPVLCLSLSSSLVEVNRVCGSVRGGGVCYSGDSVGSVAVYFCDDGYTLQGGSTRECLSTGLWNGTTPHCTETDGIGF